ncbi:MAG: lysophospholipid acyltransferase family protein [Sulfuricaulis sp.]
MNQQGEAEMLTHSGFWLRLWQIALFYLMLLWLGAMLLVANISCLPLLMTPRAFREPIVRPLISVVFRVFLFGAVRCRLMRLDLGSLDSLNSEQRIVLVANHPSMIDAVLIVSRIRNAICLIKAGISNSVFFGVGAYMAGYISNKHTEAMLRKSAEAVDKGNLLLVFPEGTRTTRQPINEIKPGVALIAKRTAAPLQIIVIVTNSEYIWGKAGVCGVRLAFRSFTRRHWGRNCCHPIR